MPASRSLFPAIVLAASVLSASAQTSPTQTWLKIMAFADQPLANADVGVYDQYGHLLYGRYDATNDEGVVPLPVGTLPENFRVVVRVDGGAYELSADQNNFDTTTGVVYVNPVTTLVSDYRDLNPWVSRKHAEERVREYLRLPRHQELGISLLHDSSYEDPDFSETVFMQAADATGDVDGYLKRLARQASSNPVSTHPFPDARAGAAAGVFKAIGQALAYSAIYFGVSGGIGWVLESSGIVQTDTTAEEIQKLQQQMKDLEAGVVGLHARFDQLQQQIDNEFTLAEIRQLRAVAADQYDYLRPIQRNLTYFTLGCPPLPSDGTQPAKVFAEYCEQQEKDLVAALNDPDLAASFGRVASVLTEQRSPEGPGLLHLYSQFLAQTRRSFFTTADSQLVQDVADYWWGVQLESADLYVEKLHKSGFQNNPGGREVLFNFLGEPPTRLGRMQNTINTEAALLWPAVPASSVLVKAGQTLWRTDRPNPHLVASAPELCQAPPPNNPMPAAPVVTAVNIEGLTYSNPARSDVSAMADGLKIFGRGDMWDSMSQYLGFQPPPDTFNNRDFCAGNLSLFQKRAAWTRDSSAVGKFYTWTTVDGGLTSGVATGTPAWSFYVHPAARCEQYYWLPSQAPGTCGKPR